MQPVVTGASLWCRRTVAMHPACRDLCERPLALRLSQMKEPIRGQTRLRTRPGVALLLLAAVTAGGTLAGAWGPAVGDNGSRVCLDRGAPYTPPYEAWHMEAHQSWLPLGVTCTWTDPTTGDVVSQEPASTPTVLAGVSFVSGLAWVVVVSWSRRQHRPTT